MRKILTFLLLTLILSGCTAEYNEAHKPLDIVPNPRVESENDTAPIKSSERVINENRLDSDRMNALFCPPSGEKTKKTGDEVYEFYRYICADMGARDSQIYITENGIPFIYIQSTGADIAIQRKDDEVPFLLSFSYSKKDECKNGGNVVSEITSIEIRGESVVKDLQFAAHTDDCEEILAAGPRISNVLLNGTFEDLKFSIAGKYYMLNLKNLDLATLEKIPEKGHLAT